MDAHVLTPEQANLELSLWHAEAESVSSSDLYLWLRESGLPDEVAIRLKDIIETVVEVGDRVINIGKIILIKIIDFVKAHPNLAIGIAVGAAIGALVSMVPILGTYLAPVALAISTTIGAIAGHRLDKLNNGQMDNLETDLITISRDVVEIAKEFFKLLIDIFNTVFDQQVFQGI